MSRLIRVAGLLAAGAGIGVAGVASAGGAGLKAAAGLAERAEREAERLGKAALLVAGKAGDSVDGR